MRKHISFRISKDRLHIELKADGAALLLDFAREFTEALEFALEETHLLADAEEAVRQRDAEIAERLGNWERIGVQLYRFYRRSQAPKSGTSRSATLKLLAETYDLDRLIVEHLLGKRRLKVQKYIKRRRKAAIHRLYLEGKTNAQIAAKVGLHYQSVARIVREVKSKQ